jgi:hypothetical protein
MKARNLFVTFLVLCMVFALMAVPVASADDIDWESFEDWTAEDWDAKEVAYQFTGNWELAEYGYKFEFLINLYTDGSASIDQRNVNTGSSYWQFGYWSEEETEDGNEITFDTIYAVDLNGASLIAHEYSYSLYEEADGNYSFGYTFGIAPGMYFRDVDVAGGKEVTYNTFEEFHSAVDVITETIRFEGKDENPVGATLQISLYSNNTVTVWLCLEPYGPINHKDGTVAVEYDASYNASYTLVIEDTEIPLTLNEDGSFADFSYDYDASALQADLVISSNMTQVEVPAEEEAAA